MAGFALRAAQAALLLGAGVALTGCLGPTYGTGTSSGAQLFEDLDQFARLSPSSTTIAYSPRPELVRPASVGALPAPQPTRNTTNDPSWPESPEQRSARLQAAGNAANAGDGPIAPEVLAAEKENMTIVERGTVARGGGWQRNYGNDRSTMTPGELTAARDARQRIVQEERGSPTTRRYLSEPPLAYRQPAGTAPVGDPGEDEAVKERRRTGETQPSIFQRVRDLLPGS